MKVKIPAKTVDACDICKNESMSSLLETCLICKRQYCHTCEAILCGCIVSPELCKECGDSDKARNAVQKFVKPLLAILKKRDAALRRIKIVLPIALACLCLAPGVQQKKPSEILMDLAHPPGVIVAASNQKKRTAVAPASIIPLPALAPAPSRPVTRATVAASPREVIMPFLLPPSVTNYWWRSVRTTNLADWAAVGPAYYGPQSTNSDIWTTNKLKMEFWRLHRIDLP